jgi:hypothetical protein
VRNLLFADSDRNKPRPIPVSLSQNRKQGHPNIKKNKPVQIPQDPKLLVWVGHSCLPYFAEAPSEAEGEAEGSDAFDLDLDFAEDEQDACSTVEERRFSAA